jgi:TonB-linked SusC/RagA family outer membrane protein
MKCLNFATSNVFRAFCLIFMLFSTMTLYAQTALRGVVRNEKQSPIAGATIKLKNSNQLVFSSSDGQFTINVDKFPLELEVSYLGYETQLVTVSDNRQVNVTLVDSDNEIDEVMVVAAYGTQKKSTMVGSVSQITGADIKKAPSMNITNTLGGRLPGLTTLQQSGRPGADNASLYIRGISTYGGNRSPLIIIDDVERPASSLAYLDPNDIETISILKDAVATSMYGVQGSNGIILIKTRSGVNAPAKVTYDFSYSIGENTRLPKFLDGPDYMAWYNKGVEMDNDALMNIDQSPVAFPYSQEMIDAVRNGTNENPLLGNTDWMGLLAGNNSYSQHHSATLSGGSNSTQYFTSLSHMHQDGVINHTDFKRYNVRSNITTKLASFLGFGINVGLRHQKTNTPGISPDNTGYMNPWYQAARMLPNIPQYAPNGLPTAIANQVGLLNPIASVENSGYQNYLGNIFEGQAHLNFYVPGVEGLVAKVQAAYDYNAQESKAWAQPYETMSRGMTQVSGDFSKQTTVPGITVTRLTQNHSASYRQNLQGSLNYNKVFNDHTIGALALYEFSKTYGNSFGAGVRNFPITLIHEMDYGSKDPEDVISPGGGSAAQTARAGFVGRLNYAYKEKYLLEAVNRWDASANFAKQHRWNMFPAAGLGWVVSKENFFNIKDVEYLKFKTSYGKSGNDRAQVGQFAYMSTFVQNTDPVVIIGGVPVAALYTSSVPNPDLKWEESTTLNVGFETRFLKKFSLEFDWFYKHTTGILGGVGSLYPASMGGYYPSQANIGEVDNRGFDAQLKYNEKFGDFTLNLTGNFGWARNRYLKYQEPDGTPSHLSVIGRSIGEKRGYVVEKIIQTWEEARNAPSPSSGHMAPGFFQFKDLNGDGRLTSTGDRAFIGKSNVPEIMYGLDIYMSYKGFDLSALLQGAAIADVSLAGTYEGSGGVTQAIDDNTVWTKTFYGNGNAPYFLVENSWRPDNPNAEFPRLTANQVGLSPNNANANSGWIRSGDYLRVKSLQLGYSLPSKLMSQAKIQSIRLFATGSNLFTWDDLKYIDPEMPNVTLGFYPQQRLYEFGISVTF